MNRRQMIDYMRKDSETLQFLDEIAKSTVSTLFDRNPCSVQLLTEDAVKELEKACRMRVARVYTHPAIEKILSKARETDPLAVTDPEKTDERVFREADRQTAAEQGDAPAGMYRREFPLLGSYEQTILADFISATEKVCPM